jgi:hypothetical protein
LLDTNSVSEEVHFVPVGSAQTLGCKPVIYTPLRRPLARYNVQYMLEWMTSARRRNEIVKRLQRGGLIEATRLSHELGVDVPYDVKQAAHTPAKLRIGATAAELIRGGETVLLARCHPKYAPAT